jgi:hypothetical protein
VIQLHENACLGLSRPRLEIAGIDRDQRKSIAEGIAGIATKKNISVDDVFSHLAAQFLPSGPKIDDAWLKTNLLRLKIFLHPVDPDVPKATPRRMPGRVLKKPRKCRLT